MKTAIIGYGFVGQALNSVLKTPAEILDPRHYPGKTLQDVLATNPEYIFICVPTPTVDGACDDRIVLHYVSLLKDYDGIVIIKSTIPPAIVEKLLTIRDVVVWPELLREKHADFDIKNPSLHVIGNTVEETLCKIDRLIKSGMHSHYATIQHVSPIEASIFKYAVNSFLATKVLFMHQMKQWLDARGEGESWATISKLLSQEGRVGASHLNAPGEHGYGFAGTCFPKDTEALLSQVYHDDRTTFPLLDEVVKQNKQLRNK